MHNWASFAQGRVQRPVLPGPLLCAVLPSRPWEDLSHHLCPAARVWMTANVYGELPMFQLLCLLLTRREKLSVAAQTPSDVLLEGVLITGRYIVCCTVLAEGNSLHCCPVSPGLG